jgi:hypothetical protein
MPPWGADPRYGHFANDPSLTQDEIDAIVKWVDGGASEGPAKDEPPPVRWPEGWKSTPDVVVSLPAIPVPAKGNVEWTDMIIPNPFKEDTWVNSVEIRPGVPAVVHHAGIHLVPHRDDVQLLCADLGRLSEGRSRIQDLQPTESGDRDLPQRRCKEALSCSSECDSNPRHF